MSTASKLRQRLEAQAQKRLESTKAAAAGDDDAENADLEGFLVSVGRIHEVRPEEASDTMSEALR